MLEVPTPPPDDHGKTAFAVFSCDPEEGTGIPFDQRITVLISSGFG
jgi:hypothetical protein